jgi:multidrug transporter EmrE-like cation transporter
VAALLVPVGLVLFGERLSGLNVFGLLLCVAGLLLAMAR